MIDWDFFDITAKYRVEKFDEQNFGLWCMKMHVLVGKENLPATMSKYGRDEHNIKALNTIELCLTDEVFQDVADGDL